MSEQTAEQTATTSVLPEAIDKAFQALRDSPAYAGVVPMLTEKLSAHFALVKVNNKNVAAINAAKKSDPNDTTVQDAAWKNAVESGEADDELTKLEKRFQQIQKQHEEVLAKMRKIAVEKHITAPLSEEEVTKLRQEVNAGKSVIADSVTANASIAEMADQMLTLAGAPVENGIWSLMPQPDTTMNARGRKSSGGTKTEGEGYATRLVEAFIDGKTTNRNVKRKGKDVFAAHFNYVAETLSKEFGDKEFPGNQVTAEEVEKAYYASKGADFRDSDAMPADYTFEFTKEVDTRNGADNSVKKIPVTKSIRVVRWTKDTAGKEGEIATPESEGNAAEGSTADTTMAGNVPNQA